MRKVIPWKLSKKMKFDHTNKWYMYKPESSQKNKTQKLLWDTNGSPNLDQTTSPCDNQLKIEHLPNSGFCRSGWPKSKTERKRKSRKYLHLARELKKLWNMKVTVILNIIGALGTVTKGLVQGLEDLKNRGRVKTIQNIVLSRSARILRRVLKTWGDLLLLNFL